MSMKIEYFKICQILKEENKKADALANLASTFDFILDRSIPLEFLPNPSIEVAKPACPIEASPTCMDDIIAYLQDNTLPNDKLQAHRTVLVYQILSPSWNPIQEILLRPTFTMSLT